MDANEYNKGMAMAEAAFEKDYRANYPVDAFRWAADTAMWYVNRGEIQAAEELKDQVIGVIEGGWEEWVAEHDGKATY